MMYFLGVFLAVLSINIHCAKIVLGDDVAFPCTTPERESAFCIPLFSCPGLMKSLATLEPSAIKYFKQSMCLGCKAGNFMVCCSREHLAQPTDKLGAPASTLVPSTSPSPNESKRENVLKTLIPDRRYCGLQHTDDRFYNSSKTALDEFPWLVHIKFTDIYSDYKLGDRCTGVLISNRYVLTDTLCAKLALKVRLGQYNVAHKVTCIENPQAHECSEGTIEVRIEKIIQLQPGIMESFSLTLIRLADTVDYSDFVRPICLPVKEVIRSRNQNSLIFSGWGAKPQTSVLEDAIKKRMVYDKARIDVCTKTSPYLKTYLENHTVPLHCFSPKKGNTDNACNGDHGGPLMYSDSRHQWYVEYVVVEVDYGVARCGAENPALAVKITPEIIDAILNNVEP